ncbi:MAG: chitobiase/beta-hexosaminidase C-terminal domain-containing protein, partial [Lachnospiraceae bacterium]|nr:chitobiase/beta-hexosaminidase C-terminal domain-containing protein [Lachnospiraceae bacterium]
QQYMAMAPEFGYISGSYDEVITLKISANTTGNIYYTLDGSEPDTTSQVYTAPLFLETGEYQVAAVFVNEYGIKSETARNWYVINLTAPEPPELLLYSGEYHQPTKIEVIVPEGGTVYYTMDGSNPSADSLKYTEPVAMPLGRTNFKFVTISDEGVASDVVSRSFNFTLETDVTVQSAVNSVMTALYNREVLTDLQGHSPGIMGKYVFKYNTIVEIPDLGYYYILNEYIESETGVQTKTEHLYAVEVYTGAPNRLIFDENGQAGLISLQ